MKFRHMTLSKKVATNSFRIDRWMIFRGIRCARWRALKNSVFPPERLGIVVVPLRFEHPGIEERYIHILDMIFLKQRESRILSYVLEDLI